MMRSAIVTLVVLLGAGRAYAYPQFELAKDQSCSGCHISPTGGGLLGENGEVVAESISMFGTNPAFMYGKIRPPVDWLTVGGDLRYAYGYLQAPQKYLVGFPMQAEVAGAATFGQFTAYVNVGG